jgi:hypothetical protein
MQSQQDWSAQRGEHQLIYRIQKSIKTFKPPGGMGQKPP